ncbi:MAG: DUF418 domain-containing protein [Alistipes sp.]|jgi:uncharacterized protein|nr:DUF418 domain-containing protein [Alistipes sp.]
MAPAPKPALSVAPRVDVVDALRGVAVIGILLLHSVEHFNYYRFPEDAAGPLLGFFDRAAWDSLFFTFSGKAYAIFSLLFGYTFHLQYERARREGRDFRLRFVWRMVVLLGFGCVNAAFFPGEVLVMFSLVGLVLPLVARLSDRWVLVIAVFGLLGPDFVVRTALAMAGVEVSTEGFVPWWRAAMDVLGGGDFWASAWSNLTDGQVYSLMWARDYGRMLQAPALMMAGMLIGRRGLFADGGANVRFWLKAALAGLLCFFPLRGFAEMIPEWIGDGGVADNLGQLVGQWHKLAFMVFMTGMVVVLFHRTRMRGVLMRLASPLGRMSLTMYVSQSLLGSFVFFPWGLGLGERLGSTASVGVAVAMFAVVYTFAALWLRRHRQGPLEWLWRRATWLF